MKKILITNDDGYDSKGLLALVEALKPLGEITVVAPTTEKSACGHSLTLTRPLHFVEIESNFYRLDDGTPTDCVFLSLSKLFNEKNRPDIVISGINLGANMGEDITYSGTASASMEAVLQGIPSIAISQVYHDNRATIKAFGFTLAQNTIVSLVEKIFEGTFPLPPRKFLNINIPPIPKEKSNGLKVTYAGNKRYGCDARLHYNPRGIEYYWIGLPVLEWIPKQNNQTPMSDFEAISKNYISLTPIHLDMTSYDDIQTIEEWL